MIQFLIGFAAVAAAVALLYYVLRHKDEAFVEPTVEATPPTAAPTVPAAKPKKTRKPRQPKVPTQLK